MVRLSCSNLLIPRLPFDSGKEKHCAGHRHGSASQLREGDRTSGAEYLDFACCYAGLLVVFRRYNESREDLEHPEMELLWVEIKPGPLRSRKSQHSLLVGCCYRPPHPAVTFYKNLETVLDKAVDMDIILLGDFNAKKF